MKILLVEDYAVKAEYVKEFMQKEFPQMEIVHKESYNSASREIFTNHHQYCLILLDMTMSTFDVSIDEDGGNPEPIAGCNILDGMFLRGIKTKVIVVTMYRSFDDLSLSDLHNNLLEQYPENYAGQVSFAIDRTDWQKELKNLINSII